MPIRPTSVDDPTISRALDEIRAAVPEASIFEGARLIEKIALTSGVQKRIAHGLRRKYRGRIIVGLSAVAVIADDRTKSDTDKYIYLTANANTTLTLVVF